MADFAMAKALVDHAESEFNQILGHYESSLKSADIESALQIGIKNFMENLRSALDYSAHALFVKFGNSSASKPRAYFPYARDTQTLADFRRANRIAVCIPGIGANPAAVAALEGVQHFADPKFRWLPKFMDLNNENKHQRLTPQTRTETKQLNVSSGGARLSLGQGARISIGRGAHIQIGGMVIPRGQDFAVNNPPKAIGQGEVRVMTWVSFNFTHNNEPVVPFLKESLVGTRVIVDRLSGL